MRSATVRAASRRGWVWAIVARTPRPSSRQSFGSCVVLPEPVSPATTTTWWSRIAAIRSSRRALTGSSDGYAILTRREYDRGVGRRLVAAVLCALTAAPAAHAADGVRNVLPPGANGRANGPE